jgi:glycosyltransferase involved in cell wall biosynthesis
MNTPKVSVLIATWNRKNLLRQAIESVLRQSFSDWEIIVADDGSNDGTDEMMAAYCRQDGRIRYLKGSHAGRIAVVSNRGLVAARGEYIAILDDDDYWIDREKLKKQVTFLDKNPEYVACGGGMITVDESGRELGRFLKPEADEVIKKMALYANPLVNSTTVFRREIGGTPALYDESLPQFADWGFWLELGRKGKFYNFKEYFVRYRMWDKSSSFTKQKANAQAALVIVKRYRKYYPGFGKALTLALFYRAYVALPVFTRRILNPILSSGKKKAFSK